MLSPTLRPGNHQAFAHLCVGEFLKSFLKAMLAATKLEVDRYGVPRYAGEPDLFEEYTERAWDLYFGREGTKGTPESRM